MQLTITVFMLFLLIKLSFDFWAAPPPPHIILVEMLDSDHYVIEQDTTNYDQFASILKQTIIEAKQEYPYNRILLSLPKAKKTKDISDIIMVVAAMDLDWKIKP